MKQLSIILILIGTLCFDGCSNKDVRDEAMNIRQNTEGITNTVLNDDNRQQQIDELIARIESLEKKNELFPTFSSLVFDFMTALDEENLKQLKSTVSDSFTVEIVGDTWHYISDEAVDGNNKVILQHDDNDIEHWRIDYYGQAPVTNQYSMTIRLFTEKSIKHNVTDVFNIHFIEENGVWKIASVDKFV